MARAPTVNVRVQVTTSEMTWLWALNFVLLQWLGLRLVRVVEINGSWRIVGVLWPVLPLSGWWTGYVPRKPRVRLFRRCCDGA